MKCFLGGTMQKVAFGSIVALASIPLSLLLFCLRHGIERRL